MIFGSIGKIFGGGSETTETARTNQEQETRTDQTQRQSRNVKTVNEGESLNVTDVRQQTETEFLNELRTLDDETINFLKGLNDVLGTRVGAIDLTGLASEIAGGTTTELGDISDFILNRAKGTSDFIAANIDPILASERRAGEEAIKRGAASIASRTGSALNTAVLSETNRAQTDLNVDLARLGSEIALSGRELESRDLAAAFDAALQTAGFGVGAGRFALDVENSAAGNIANISSVLKGAIATERGTSVTETSGRTVESGKFSESSNLGEIIDAVLSGRSSSEATSFARGTAETEETAGLGDILTGIGSLSGFF